MIRLKDSDFLISKLNIKPQQLKQASTGIKIDIMYLQNRTNSLEINHYIYGQLIFDKDSKKIQGEIIIISKNGAGITGQPHAKEMKLNLTHTTYKK